MNAIKTIGAIALAWFVTASFIPEAHAQDTVQGAQKNPDPKLLGSGIIALAVPYVASVFVAGVNDHPGDQSLYVPVAGPWIDLADRRCAGGGSCDDNFNKGMLVLDGVVQAFGALDIAAAFLFPQNATAPKTVRRETPTAVASIRVGPSGVGGGYGLIAMGAF